MRYSPSWPNSTANQKNRWRSTRPDLETTAASSYFETRRGRTQKKYVKLSIGVLCGSLCRRDWCWAGDRATTSRMLSPLLVKTATAVHPSAVC